MDVKYLFFHTAAANIRNVDAGVIDRWHRERGFNRIGYHYVIINDRHDTLADGTVQKGRPENMIGAHVLGANNSIGVCCVGHGDYRDFTAKQKESLVRLLVDLARRYRVPLRNILGHREVNTLIARGEISPTYRTSKSCPGKKVSTDQIRTLVSQAMASGFDMAATDDGNALEGLVAATADPVEDVRHALGVLAANEHLFGNATPEWRTFYFNGEVRGLVEENAQVAEA